MLERGGVVTEFPPGAPARPLHFPRRNRILAALCDVLVLVEGGEKSGARSTVDFALEQGREVLAVPRDILHPGSALPNRLLRDGAAPALSAAEVLHHLPASVRSAAAAGEVRDPEAAPGSAGEARDPEAAPAAAGEPGGGLGIAPGIPGASSAASRAPLDDRILSLLSVRPQGLDACLRAMPGATPGAVSAALSRLEVIGRIRRLPGGRFQIPA
jgi:DNA processing protein